MKKHFLRPALALPGRDVLSLLRRLPALLILTALLGFLCLAAAKTLSAGSESSLAAAPVALVDEDASRASRLAVRMVAGAAMSDAMDIESVTKEEALAGLADGTYCAAIILPEGYADSVLTGRSTSAALLLSDSMEVYTELVSRLAKAGEVMLEAGQFGVFAGENAVLAEDSGAYDAYLTESNLLYIAEAFASGNIVREELPYSDTGVGNVEWYGLCWYCCCLLLLSLFFGFLRDGAYGSMLRRITASGLKPEAIVLSRLLTTWMFRFVLTFCVMAGLRLTGTAETRLTPAAVLALLLLSAVGNALLLCLRESALAPVTAAAAAAGLLFSGGLVPRMELPQAFTAAGDFLPAGAAARLLASAFGAPCGILPVLTAAGWIVFSLLLTDAVLRYRLREGESSNA